MSYRPICDTWILARPKVKYYGAYPNGFLERALPLLGVSGQYDPVMHLCSGRAADYPQKRHVMQAITVDSDASVKPYIHQDLNAPDAVERIKERWQQPLRAVLIDPPYTPEDHAKYDAGGCELPSANKLLRLGLDLLEPGGKVGVLHYVWPQPPKHAKSIAAVGVLMGFNNRIRVYSVFEKVATDGE